MSGGTVSYTYLWSTIPAQTTSSATGLSVGTYTITVTDSKSCTKTASYTITQPAILSVTTNLVDVSCYGGNNGSITTNVSGGTTPYSYLWSTAQTTSSVTGLIAGSYTITVTDSKGCSNEKTISISMPSVIDITTTITDATCASCANGKINVNISGGTTPYSYSWSNGSIKKDSLTALLPGIYNLTITDAKGCKKIADSLIVSFTTGIASAIDNRINIYPNPVYNKLFVEIENIENKDVQIIISTVTGKEIFKQNYKPNSDTRFVKELEMNDLADQLYLVSVKINKQVYFKKISKIR